MADPREDARWKFEGDVCYDVWLSGGDPDAVDYDRVDESWRAGDDYADVAASELRAQR